MPSLQIPRLANTTVPARDRPCTVWCPRSERDLSEQQHRRCTAKRRTHRQPPPSAPFAARNTDEPVHGWQPEWRESPTRKGGAQPTHSDQRDELKELAPRRRMVAFPRRAHQVRTRALSSHHLLPLGEQFQHSVAQTFRRTESKSCRKFAATAGGTAIYKGGRTMNGSSFLAPRQPDFFPW